MHLKFILFKRQWDREKFIPPFTLDSIVYIISKRNLSDQILRDVRYVQSYAKAKNNDNNLDIYNRSSYFPNYHYYSSDYGAYDVGQNRLE